MLVNAYLSLAQTKPNVILILADDQGWGDLHINGNPWLETPNIDNLSSKGTTLENFYVSPLCAPTRASILSGRYHLRTGTISVSKGLEVMDNNETTLAEIFKANGYRTGIFGKWHNGAHYPNRPNDQGFDEFLGFCAGHWSNYFNTTLSHNGQDIKTKGYITDVFTDAAMKFITSSDKQPFFCYIPYNAPHSPHQVPDKYFNKYKDKGLDNELSCIYGMVDNMDENIGRLVNLIRKKNLEENTIIIFMSDNGPNGNRYNGDLRGIKGSVFEGGIRVPFFISWKNHINHGISKSQPMAHIDILPTLQKLCGLKSKLEKPIDGIDFSSLLLTNAKEKDTLFQSRDLFTHVNFMDLPFTPFPGSMRSNRFHFINEKSGIQLYDLVKDPGEKHDLSEEENTTTQQFYKSYLKWFDKVTAKQNYGRPLVLSDKGLQLPVFEGTLTGGIKYKEGHGWAHDWIEKWTSTKDSILWEVNCLRAGKYKIEMEYLCPPDQVGSLLVCKIGDNTLESKIKRPHMSPLLPSPDRIPRKEAYEVRTWGKIKLGTLWVDEGITQVILSVKKIGNQNVGEIKSLTISPN